MCNLEYEKKVNIEALKCKDRNGSFLSGTMNLQIG